MRKYLHNFKWMTLAVATMLTVVGCEETETSIDEKVPAEPKIISAEYIAEKSTDSSESFAVEYEDAKLIYYTCYTAGEDKEWKSTVVSKTDGSVELTFASLEATAEYTAEFYAKNGKEVSATKSVNFSTIHPMINEVAVNEAEITADAASFSVDYSDASTLEYAIYVAGSNDEKSWVSEEVSDSPAVITVGELEAETEYTVEVCAVYGNSKSESKSASFKTLAPDPVPAVGGVELDEESVSESTASFNVAVSEATEVFYRAYKKSESVGADELWASKAAEAESVAIAFEGLDAETEYVAEFYAANGEFKSEVVAKEFSTNAAPVTVSPEITLEAMEATITENSATILIGYNADVASIFMTFGKKGEEMPAPMEFPMYAVGAGSMEFPLSSLEAGVEYVFSAYPAKDGVVGETKEVSFTTKAVEVAAPEVSLAMGPITATAASVTVSYNAEVQTLYYVWYQASVNGDDYPYYDYPVNATADGSIDIPATYLSANTEYVFAAYGVNGDVTGEVAKINFTTIEAVGPEVALSIGNITAVSAQATVTFDTSYASYGKPIYFRHFKSSEAETTEAEWTSMVNWMGSSIMTFDVLNLEELTEYTVEVYGEDNGAVGNVASASFTTLEDLSMPLADAVSITNFVSTPFGASFDVEILSDAVEAVAIKSYQGNWYDASNFKSDLVYGSGMTYIYESGHVEYAPDPAFTPQSDYVIAYAPLNNMVDGENWGTAFTTGTMLSSEVGRVDFTTPAPEAGAVDVNMTLELTEATFGSLKVNFTRTEENTTDFYSGIVPVADAPDGDIAAWIAAQDKWFVNNYSESFTQFSYSTYEYVEVETVAKTYANLVSGAEYYVFGIAVSGGQLGNITVEKFSTTELVVDNTIGYSVDVVPAETSATYNFNFGEKCAKIIYYNNEPGSYSAQSSEAIAKMLMSYLLDGGSSTNTAYVANAVDGVVSINKDYLSMGVDFELHVMAVSEDGAVSDVQIIEYATKAPEFNSAASVNLTLSKTNYEAQYGAVTLEFDVEMVDGAVSYKFLAFDKVYVNNDVAQAYGTYLLGHYPSTSSNAKMTNVYLPNKNYIVCVVPVDADGAYGMPVVYNFDWSTVE